MAGHSKWSKDKHIKGPLDVKRGAAFGKLVKEITVPARVGGGDLSGHPRLPLAIQTVCDQNPPKENAATDYKNRLDADLRFMFSQKHGNPAAVGSVPSMFHQNGVPTMPRPLSAEDRTSGLTLAV